MQLNINGKVAAIVAASVVAASGLGLAASQAAELTDPAASGCSPGGNAGTEANADVRAATAEQDHHQQQPGVTECVCSSESQLRCGSVPDVRSQHRQCRHG